MIKVLALDLEATLISDAMNMIPRPGLSSFLDFCHDTFARVAIFTTVDAEAASEALDELCEQRLLSEELRGRLELIDWNGQYKDLRFVADALPTEILLVDDDPHWIHPDQQSQWIAIQPWHGDVAGQPDRELQRVRALLDLQQES